MKQNKNLWRTMPHVSTLSHEQENKKEGPEKKTLLIGKNKKTKENNIVSALNTTTKTK